MCSNFDPSLTGVEIQSGLYQSSSSLRSISNKEELLTTSGPVATEQIRDANCLVGK